MEWQVCQLVTSVWQPYLLGPASWETAQPGLKPGLVFFIYGGKSQLLEWGLGPVSQTEYLRQPNHTGLTIIHGVIKTGKSTPLLILGSRLAVFIERMLLDMDETCWELGYTTFEVFLSLSCSLLYFLLHLIHKIFYHNIILYVKFCSTGVNWAKSKIGMCRE